MHFNGAEDGLKLFLNFAVERFAICNSPKQNKTIRKKVDKDVVAKEMQRIEIENWKYFVVTKKLAHFTRTDDA